MPIISVEGVVGAGKTSLLKCLENVKLGKKHVIVYEPVDEWLSLKLNGPDKPSLFEEFYADQKKNGFLFQMYALQTRIQKIIDTSHEHPDAVIICERSHLSDSAIFAKMLHDMNILSKEEYHVYTLWYDMCLKNITSKVDGIIYVEAPPHVCIERILKRGRSGEDQINVNYIKKLHFLHDAFIRQNDSKVCIVTGKQIGRAHV